LVTGSCMSTSRRITLKKVPVELGDPRWASGQRWGVLVAAMWCSEPTGSTTGEADFHRRNSLADEDKIIEP
jgi:hypothetical protein